MKSFNALKYELVGFGPIRYQDGTTVSCWHLRTKPDPTIPHFIQSDVMVPEFKFVDNGKVTFCYQDGTMESHEIAFVEARA
jgi:hypothetical protein